MPSKPSARTAAAIDIGSNSVHLLAARSRKPVKQGSRVELMALADDSDLIGLGDPVDGTGAIPPAEIQAVVDSVDGLLAHARDVGAMRALIVGTEPLRRATNTDELNAAVSRSTGNSITVLTEHQEAQLTFLGVTGGPAPSEALAVVDIGGGSTEVSLHIPGEKLQVVPLPVGSGRLTNAIVRNDPPTIDELNELKAAAHEIVDAALWPDYGAGTIRRAIFVGGTATNIARLGLLDRAHLNDDLSTLALLTADEVVEHYGVRPRRARQLAAGIAIVCALLDRFLLGQAEVTEASLRDGAIIAALSGGDDWLGALEQLVG